MASKSSTPGSLMLLSAASAALLFGLASSSVGGRQAGSNPQAFLLPPASSAVAPPRAANAAAEAFRVQPQAQTIAAPAAALAVAMAAATLGLASRRSATAASKSARGARVVAAAAADDDDETFADDDQALEYDDEFDEDDEDEFYDDDEEDEDALSATCRARFLKGSPSKFRRVLWQIRGRSYRDALMLLEFMPWRACKPILCAVQSAASNAQNQFNMDKSRLYIKKCVASDGPIMKRMRPAAKGQTHPYVRKTTHLRIEVAEMNDSQLAQMEF